MTTSRRTSYGLGQDGSGGKLKHQLDGLPRGEGRWDRQAPPYLAEATGMPEALQSGPSARHHGKRLPEIADPTVAEIADEETYQDDCARTRCKVFDKDKDQGSELQAADLEKVPRFERRIRAQYADVFREPTGLPPMCKDDGFRIRTILGAEPPHRSPYR